MLARKNNLSAHGARPGGNEQRDLSCRACARRSTELTRPKQCALHHRSSRRLGPCCLRVQPPNEVPVAPCRLLRTRRQHHRGTARCTAPRSGAWTAARANEFVTSCRPRSAHENTARLQMPSKQSVAGRQSSSPNRCTSLASSVASRAGIYSRASGASSRKARAWLGGGGDQNLVNERVSIGLDRSHIGISAQRSREREEQ